AGNIFITGMFQKSVDFDPGAAMYLLTSHGGFDVFVAKYDTSGNYLWARGFGGTGGTADVGYGIAVDAADNVLVTGQFGGAMVYDNQQPQLRLTSAGSSDVFILKLSGDGSTLWGRRIGGSGADRATDIATDEAG